MAIIKCPECGHQTSDKAPYCPNCGVEIAGKVVKCPNCGEIYFKNEGVCPHCHQPIGGAGNEISQNIQQAEPAAEGVETSKQGQTQARTEATPPQPPVMPNASNQASGGSEDPPIPPTPSKNKQTVIWISAIIAVLALCLSFYLYNKYSNAQEDKEQSEYEFAMQSSDPMVLQEYLNNFKDAPQEHIDSINAHLQRLTQQDADWTNAVVNNSRSAFEAYLEAHPDSPHRQEALDKIDSIDWAQCSRINTSDAYQSYIDNHQNGNYYEEALAALKKVQATEVSPEEKQQIESLFHKFFSSINSKNKSGLMETLDLTVDFLGRQDVPQTEIANAMVAQSSESTQSSIWKLSNDYKIQKKQIVDDNFEYNVTFTATKSTQKADGNVASKLWKINAKVGSDWTITAISMN